MKDKDVRTVRQGFVSSCGDCDSPNHFEQEFYQRLSGLLGMPISDAEDLALAKQGGVPAESVYRLFKISGGLINPESFPFSKGLFRRSIGNKYLAGKESKQIVLLASIIVQACFVFGSEEKALRWLERIHPRLSNNTNALQLCLTEDGFGQVTEKLYSIEHGFAA